MARNCIVKRLYQAFTPYIQFAGWVPLMGTCVWFFFSFAVSQTEAFAGIAEKVNVLHDSIIQMRQEIHDIHEWLKEGRRR